MKKFIFLFLLVIFSSISHGQGIEKDIFEDLKYRSQGYSATFKKNIFDDLVFSDNQKNKIEFTKKYLDLQFPGIHDSEGKKISLFEQLLLTHQKDNGYVATYKVDIFDTVIFEDNRGNKTEMGKDIHGNSTFKENRGGKSSSISTNFRGEVEYSSGGVKATLKKTFKGTWMYEDTDKNTIEFSSKAWDKMLEKFGRKEDVLFFFVQEFLY
ncbi:hypothetical protein [Myroides sp. LoEW2-1]|uniref:hypothetical protein n=1 Tax=Myroides sp. LoEW2-1 TaxID=2683192 RepID=UPI0013222128|nr:hypothetical protein [Myroides sp. LoEW2-1]MVX37187.1 hypothetical protein [Myroides sp. LoEW2-1]